VKASTGNLGAAQLHSADRTKRCDDALGSLEKIPSLYRRAVCDSVNERQLDFGVSASENVSYRNAATTRPFGRCHSAFARGLNVADCNCSIEARNHHGPSVETTSPGFPPLTRIASFGPNSFTSVPRRVVKLPALDRTRESVRDTSIGDKAPIDPRIVTCNLRCVGGFCFILRSFGASPN
jgi:hypothetical protein